MAVSGSTDFKSSAVLLIEDARRLLGVHAEEEALEAHELVTGLRFMTRMFKAWEADGIGSWVLTEGSLTLVSSQAAYTFGAGGDFATIPFEITQVRVSVDGGNEIEMTRLSREEYYRLPSRTSTGFPTQFYYDRQRDDGSLKLWPAPNSSNYDITFTYRRRIMDVDVGADNADLPPEWEEAIINNLARRLIPVYGRAGTPEATQVVIDAGTSYQAVKNWDVGGENGSVMMSRDPYDRYYR